jgi:hypothetical protein
MSQKTYFIYITAILAIFSGLKVIHIVSLGNGADPRAIMHLNQSISSRGWIFTTMVLANTVASQLRLPAR